MSLLSVEQREGVTVLHLRPEYGATDPTVPPELQKILELAATASPPLMLLDCNETQHADSAFINVVVRCHDQIEQRGGRFALCCLQGQLKARLDALNLNLMLSIYDSVTAAIAAMKPGSQDASSDSDGSSYYI